MKLCLMGPPLGECGGIQRVMVSVANELAKKYEVTLLSIQNPKENSYYGVDPSIRICNMNRDYGKKGQLLRRVVKKIVRSQSPILPASVAAWTYDPKDMVGDLQRILKEGQFDCVIASAVPCTLLLGLAAPGLRGIRLVGWHHNSFRIYFQTKGCGFYAQQRLAEKALGELDQLVSLTRRDAEEYQRNMGLPCTYIYNPLSFFSEKKSEVNQKNLLFVSRLEVQQKGLDFLVDIAEELFHRRGYRDWKLQIVGNGSGYESLKKWIQERNLEDQVELLGEQKEVQPFYQNASVFLSTSRWEGFGVVITEAMECGLPVVAFETDGPMEILQNGENGYLISNYDLDKYADAVENLMKDEALRWTMSRNAIKRARNFYPDKIVKEWEKVIEER